MKKYVMKYREAAENSLTGWENSSLPIGNGYFGASVFGGIKSERIQFTINEFANVYSLGGVTSFADFFIESDYADVTDYERGLDLNEGVAYSSFCCNGVKTERTAFCSYPDNVFVYRIKTSLKRDFVARLVIPYLGSRTESEGGRVGETYAENGSLVIRQILPLRECVGELRLSVLTDGESLITDKTIEIKNAAELTFLVVLGTNYKLCPKVFADDCHKAIGEDPDEKLKSFENNARKKGYKELFESHIADYGELMNRARIDLGGICDNRPIPQLLNSYRSGKYEPYLIETYFEFQKRYSACVVTGNLVGSRQVSVGQRYMAQHQRADELLVRA